MVAMTELCQCSVNVIDMLMNKPTFDTIKLYLQKQVWDQIWSTGSSLRALDL